MTKQQFLEYVTAWMGGVIGLLSGIFARNLINKKAKNRLKRMREHHMNKLAKELEKKN